MRWRPHPAIRNKVIGLCLRDGHLLAARVWEDSGRVKGYRPPGGSIEFGETREITLRREFREEFDVDVAAVGPWHTFENIYEHEGETGHEFIFAAVCKISDALGQGLEPIAFVEDAGDPQIADWLPLGAVEEGAVELYPTGLRQRLGVILT